MIMEHAENKENVALASNLKIESRDVLTGCITTTWARNLVVDVGIRIVRDLMGGTGHRPSHIGMGTGATAVTAVDTSIETEQFRGEITRRDDLTLGIEFQLFMGLNDGNGFTYIEAGLLETGPQNGASGDPAILFARANIPGIAKTTSVELTLTWTINIAAT